MHGSLHSNGDMIVMIRMHKEGRNVKEHRNNKMLNGNCEDGSK